MEYVACLNITHSAVSSWMYGCMMFAVWVLLFARNFLPGSASHKAFVLMAFGFRMNVL